MTTSSGGAAGVDPRPWPYCSHIDGTCLAHEIGRSLGAGVESSLLTFVLTAEEGARLTLQRNREAFTVQITGAVQKGTGEEIGLPEVRLLRKRLDASGEAGQKR